ncbi:hypothetical protein LTS18_010619, partial [Coniosporium uncinatum]
CLTPTLITSLNCDSITDLSCLCSNGQGKGLEAKLRDCVINGCGAMTAVGVKPKVDAVCSCVRKARDEL